MLGVARTWTEFWRGDQIGHRNINWGTTARERPIIMTACISVGGTNGPLIPPGEHVSDNPAIDDKFSWIRDGSSFVFSFRPTKVVPKLTACCFNLWGVILLDGIACAFQLFRVVHNEFSGSIVSKASNNGSGSPGTSVGCSTVALSTQSMHPLEHNIGNNSFINFDIFIRKFLSVASHSATVSESGSEIL